MRKWLCTFRRFNRSTFISNEISNKSRRSNIFKL